METRNIKKEAREHMRSRLADIRAMIDHEREHNGDPHPEHGPLNEYGLSYDYVPPGTFQGQRRGYMRCQISWGGPSEEIRIRLDKRGELTSAAFWFLDWFTGHGVKLSGRNLDTVRDLFEEHGGAGYARTLIAQEAEA